MNENIAAIHTNNATINTDPGANTDPGTRSLWCNAGRNGIAC